MKLYRCTRNSLYSHHECIGYTQIDKRNGYFIEAKNERHALKIMTRKFSEDREGFTIELWDEREVKKSAIAFWVEYFRARFK